MDGVGLAYSRRYVSAILLPLSALFTDHDTPYLLTGVKIILLHELKNDEGIRLFLQETWEIYVKVGRYRQFPFPCSPRSPYLSLLHRLS